MRIIRTSGGPQRDYGELYDFTFDFMRDAENVDYSNYELNELATKSVLTRLLADLESSIGGALIHLELDKDHYEPFDRSDPQDDMEYIANLERQVSKAQEIVLDMVKNINQAKEIINERSQPHTSLKNPTHPFMVNKPITHRRLK